VAGGQQFVLERNWFNRNWPRWLAAIVANCPEKDVNRYLIANMYEEGVCDPRVDTDHNDLHMRLGESLGLSREQIHSHAASPVTVAATSYWENMARTRPWLEAFAALTSIEIRASQRAMGSHFRTKKVRSSDAWAKLGVPREALATFTNHEAADEDHGLEALALLVKHADTEEKQEAVLRAIRDSLAVERTFKNNIGDMMMAGA
jgi:pyrroloquinoline quinone (PQQ) biosynthesis protein C